MRSFRGEIIWISKLFFVYLYQNNISTMDNFNLKDYLAENKLLKEEIDTFLNDNFDEVKIKIKNIPSKFKIMGDSKVATAADGERGIDISFDKEHMLSLFPEEDPFNEVESMEIAGKTVYYNDYLAENKLLKEVTFADVKAAAEKKPGYEGEEGEDGFSIPYEFGTINMYNRPSGGDGTGDVGIEYESGGTTQETGFISYGKAKYIVQKSLAEGDSDEEDLTSFMNKGIYGTSIDDLKEEDSNKLSAFLKSKVEAAVDGLTKKIMFTINSEKSAQEMSEIFKSVTFRMGQLLESYATYTQRVQQSNNSDDSLEKIADAENDLDISLGKIDKDIMGRLS